MGYFPFFIDIKDCDALVVGGGRVALRKVEKLAPFEPKITVIAPEICKEIEQLNVKTVRRRFEDSDIENRAFVISATDDEAVNERIFMLCTERKILVNTVDDKEKCGFIFPALTVRENVTVGITTGGKSPMFAKFVRENIDSLLDEKTLAAAEILGRYRDVIKLRFESERRRCEVNAALLRLCTQSTYMPTDMEINDMLWRLEKGYEIEDRNEKI